MKERILQMVEEIKENLNLIDDSGIDPKILRDIFDNLNFIEDELYNDSVGSFGFNPEDFED